MTEKPDRTIFLSKNQILRCENKDICEMVEKTAQKAIIQGYMSSNWLYIMPTIPYPARNVFDIWNRRWKSQISETGFHGLWIVNRHELLRDA